MASVFLKRDTWYLKVREASGRWVAKASTATNKTEAKRIAAGGTRAKGGSCRDS